MRSKLACLLCLTVMTSAGATEPPSAPASPSKPWPLPSLGTPPPAEALPALPQGALDLSSLIDLAQQSNPKTRAAWDEARAAAAAAGLARSAYLPQIALDALAGAEHTPLPSQTPVKGRQYFISDTRQFIPSLTVKWLLFDFGRRDAARDRADALSFTANVQFTAAHQQLVYAVSKSFYALVAAKARLHAATEGFDTAQVDHQAVFGRRQHGVATVVDLARADRRVATARLALVRATGAVAAAQAELIAATGLSPGSPLQVIDDVSTALPLPPTARVASYVSQALAARPDVLAALSKLQAAEASVREAEADFRPTLSTEAKVFQNDGRLRADDGPWSSVHRPGGSIFLRFSWDVFDGGARRSRLAMSKAARDGAKDAYDAIRDQAGKEVAQALVNLQSALAAAAAAHEVAQTAKISHEAALRGFRQGVTTFDELADEADALSSAIADEDSSRSEAFTAAAALALAMGAMPQAKGP